MTQELDLKELRKIAEQATPGPWSMWNPSEGESHISIANKIAWRSVVSASEFADDDPIPHWSDALHIATFDPPTVLALLARLEQAEAQVARVRAMAKDWDANGNSAPLGDPSADVWHATANAIRSALDGDGRG